MISLWYTVEKQRKGAGILINKKHFGHRTADYRRNLGLSQTELADKLGVTAQAVSKWETGATLPDVELLLELSHLFRLSVNELLEDNSFISRISVQPFEENQGVAYFTPSMPTDLQWAEWERAMREEHWIERNWRTAWGQSGGWTESVILPNQQKLELGQRIAQRGGIILEIGAGPGLHTGY